MSINGAPVMAATVVAVDAGKNKAALSVTGADRHRLLVRRVRDERTGGHRGAGAGVRFAASRSGEGWVGGGRALSPTAAGSGCAVGRAGVGAQSGSGGRDGAHVRNKAAHIAVGVDVDGIKHVLGIWVQTSKVRRSTAFPAEFHWCNDDAVGRSQASCQGPQRPHASPTGWQG
jgi:Transposase, Mutator family